MIVTDPIKSTFALTFFLALVAVLVILGAILLHDNAERRKEAVGTLKNIMQALGFTAPGYYLPDKAINAERDLTLWAPWYIRGLFSVYIGLFILALAA